MTRFARLVERLSSVVQRLDTSGLDCLKRPGRGSLQRPCVCRPEGRGLSNLRLDVVGRPIDTGVAGPLAGPGDPQAWPLQQVTGFPQRHRMLAQRLPLLVRARLLLDLALEGDHDLDGSPDGIGGRIDDRRP